MLDITAQQEQLYQHPKQVILQEAYALEVTTVQKVQLHLHHVLQERTSQELGQICVRHVPLVSTVRWVAHKQLFALMDIVLQDQQLPPCVRMVHIQILSYFNLLAQTTV